MDTLQASHEAGAAGLSAEARRRIVSVYGAAEAMPEPHKQRLKRHLPPVRSPHAQAVRQRAPDRRRLLQNKAGFQSMMMESKRLGALGLDAQGAGVLRGGCIGGDGDPDGSLVAALARGCRLVAWG